MSVTNSVVKQWREKYAHSKKPGPEGYMMLVAEVADLLVEATLTSVFGSRFLAKEIPYIYKGQTFPGFKLGNVIKNIG